MPPWRTTVETFAGSSPLSFAIVASASSAEPRCCTSKSGGTYSSSITGVIGMTLIRRTAPPEAFASSTAVASAGLTNSGSARSTGTRIFWNMAALPKRAQDQSAYILPQCAAKRARKSLGRGGLLPRFFAAAPQKIARDVGEPRRRQRREGQGAGHLDGGKPQTRGEQPVQDALAEAGGQLCGDAVTEHLLDQAVAGRPAP